ncbi:hypothetical protein Tco_0984639 [Tanacetum coccineum]
MSKHKEIYVTPSHTKKVFAQAKEIASLKKRVKKLERKRKLKPPGMKRLFKIGRSAQVVSSKDEEVTLDMVEKEVSTAEATTDSTTTTIIDELTLAQTLIELKAAKPKTVTTAATTTTIVVARPKARGVVV